MRSYGIPHVHNPGRKGDQYVLLNVRLPREVGTPGRLPASQSSPSASCPEALHDGAALHSSHAQGRTPAARR